MADKKLLPTQEKTAEGRIEEILDRYAFSDDDGKRFKIILTQIKEYDGLMPEISDILPRNHVRCFPDGFEYGTKTDHGYSVIDTKRKLKVDFFLSEADFV